MRRAVAAVPAARPFLAALNLAEPDVVAEALQFVLPRYDDLELAQLDLARHDADLEMRGAGPGRGAARAAGGTAGAAGGGPPS